MDAEDIAFLQDSGAPSPAISEQSQVVGVPIDDDSSNEALVVDCESPSSSSTPGKLDLFLCKFYNRIYMLKAHKNQFYFLHKMLQMSFCFTTAVFV